MQSTFPVFLCSFDFVIRIFLHRALSFADWTAPFLFVLTFNRDIYETRSIYERDPVDLQPRKSSSHRRRTNDDDNDDDDAVVPLPCPLLFFFSARIPNQAGAVRRALFVSTAVESITISSRLSQNHDPFFPSYVIEEDSLIIGASGVYG